MRRGAVMLSLLLAIPAFGAETQVIKVRVSGHGTLELTMPKEWTSRVQSLGEMPPTVRVTGPADEPKLLITVFWNTAEEPKFNSAESINVLMAGIVEHIQPSAVQEKLEIHDLHGFAGPGKYTWATDRQPRPGEYEHMAQGMYAVGDLLLQFTVLTHGAPPKSLGKSLEVVKSAKQSR